MSGRFFELLFQPAAEDLEEEACKKWNALCKIVQQRKAGWGCLFYDPQVQTFGWSSYFIITSNTVIPKENFDANEYEVQFTKANGNLKCFQLRSILKSDPYHVASGLVVIFVDSESSELNHIICSRFRRGRCSILKNLKPEIGCKKEESQYCYVGGKCHKYDQGKPLCEEDGSPPIKFTECCYILLEGNDREKKVVGILNIQGDKQQSSVPIWWKTSSVEQILGLPDKPIITNGEGKIEVEFSVTWSGSNLNGVNDIKNYRLELWKKTGAGCKELLKNAKIHFNETCFNITGLEFNSEYEVRLYAVNKYGESEPDVRTFETKNDKVDEMGKKLDEKIDGVNETLKGLRLREILDPGKEKGSELESELPKVPADIHGHTLEVDRIVKILTDDSRKDIAGVLVSGIPGIGKSTVSIQAGHKLKDDLGRIVKFCSLRDMQPAKNGRNTKDDKGERVSREILSTCQPNQQATQEYPEHVLLNWCRRLEQDLVLVLDNAEDAMEDSFNDSFIHLLTKMRTFSKEKIKFIITSRRTDIRSTDPVSFNVEKVPIESLSEEDSIQVLKGDGRFQMDSSVSAEKLRKVAELCECIPLALRLASPLLSSDSEYSVDELIVDLEKHPTRTLECEAVMEIAFEKLSEPLQHSLIRLSVFSLSFEKNAAEALLGDHCAENLMKLRKRCFIQKIGDRYLLHLLIRSYARTIGAEIFPDILNHGQQAFDEHFLAMISGNTKMYMRKDNCKASFDLFNEERLNYESLLRNVIDEKIRNCDRLRDIVNDCWNVALYVEYCIPVKLYEEFLKGLLCYVQKQNETVHEVEILCLLQYEGRKQGCAKMRTEGWMDRASTLFQEHQPAFKKSVPSKVSYLNHYSSYLAQDCGQINKAQDFLKEALSMCESYEKETTEWLPDKARILGQMGHGAKFQGREEEARKCFLQALEFRQVHFGNHILTAFSYKNLADYYLKCEDLPLAEENYTKAINIMKRLNKAEHKEAIPMYKKMGICLEKSEMFDESRKMYEKGSEIADNTIEGNHKWKVRIQTYLALLLHSKYTNAAAEAVRIAEDVLEMGRDLGMKNWRRKEELEKMSQTQ